MIEQDTIRLLRECDAGIRMGVASIDDVIEDADQPGLRRALSDCRTGHTALGREVEAQLKRFHDRGKSPNPMAKTMNYLKAHMLLTFKPGDSSVADLVVTGCNMGIKNLHRYQNQYRAADPHTKEVADQLIGLEADLANSLYPYL